MNVQSNASAPRQPERAQSRATERTETRRLERPSRAHLTDDSRFAIDLTRVPKGYTMEWKRHELMGMRDRRNLVIVRQNHWEPVPHKTQPHIFGHTCTNEDEHVIVDGLGLYMRPTYLNQDAAAEHREETDYQLGQQLEALRLSSRQQVGERYTKIKRTVEAVQAVE